MSEVVEKERLVLWVLRVIHDLEELFFLLWLVFREDWLEYVNYDLRLGRHAPIYDVPPEKSLEVILKTHFFASYLLVSLNQCLISLQSIVLITK